MRERFQSAEQTVNLLDVARVAGCSPSTVSRVLNTPEIVRDEVAQRVLAAVRKLGYTPNNAARALRSRRTRMIGAVLPTLDHAIYARVANALENRLGEEGYSLIVTTSGFDARKEFRQTQLLIERGAEGVVLVGTSHDKALYEFLHIRKVPYINTYVYDPYAGHPCVGFDNRAAAKQVADYLMSVGHREFAILSGVRKDNDRVNSRIEGIRAALAERGLRVPEERIVEAPYAITSGRDAARKLLSQPERASAIICSSDILAFGCISECIAAGISVPSQISITGFDDLEFAPHLNPPLTTMQVPATDMGVHAGNFLLEKLDGKSPLECIELEAKLIIRGTVGAPVTATAAS
ncbi:LacI family DNA-binding transcriptional regulator [Caballeronia sp. LjRoot34]|uniref:LacI family DNA-binding transcriptional regulator n=1 Tax=Caballeronia sp. LjRoot34 TaxID=3342325 RepID=UPI003ECF3E19